MDGRRRRSHEDGQVLNANQRQRVHEMSRATRMGEATNA
jgi:hypothetical protein